MAAARPCISLETASEALEELTVYLCELRRFGQPKQWDSIAPPGAWNQDALRVLSRVYLENGQRLYAGFVFAVWKQWASIKPAVADHIELIRKAARASGGAVRVGDVSGQSAHEVAITLIDPFERCHRWLDDPDGCKPPGASICGYRMQTLRADPQRGQYWTYIYPTDSGRQFAVPQQSLSSKHANGTGWVTVLGNKVHRNIWPDTFALPDRIAVERRFWLDESPTAKPRSRRGRKKATYQTIQRERKMASDWARARDSRVSKADFAKDQEMELEAFDNLLDRVAKRTDRSNK
jgi:hypothetical protein